MAEKTEQNVEHLHGLKTAIWLYWKLWEKNSKTVSEYEEDIVSRVINEAETQDSLIDSICAGLLGLSSVLSSFISSTESSDNGSPRICLIREKDGWVFARGMGKEAPNHHVEMSNALLTQLEIHTELNYSMRELVTDIFLQEIFESEINNVTIPGFRRVSSKEKSTIVLELVDKATSVCDE